MNNQFSDFRKYAMSMNGSQRVSGMVIDDYAKYVNNTPVMYQSPYITERSEMNMTQVDVFSRLMRDRIIFIADAVDDTMASIVNAQLLWLSNSDTESGVQMYINSPGGSIAAGNSILDTMEYIESETCPISTIALGTAASMASILLVAGTPGHRYATRRSRILIHQPLGGFGGGHTQASDMEIEVKEILYYKKQLYDFLSERTGQSYEQIEHDADRDYWMSAEEALHYGSKGIIDEIIKPKAKTAE